MLREYQTIIEKIENMIWRHAILFCEVTMLEDPGDLFYISDPETYELYYISGDSLKLSKFRDYQGKKCYKLLQERDSPCPFCTNSMLIVGQDYIWEHYNSVVGMHYLIKDRLFEWEGHRLRIEIAQNVSDPKRAKKILLELTRQQNLLMRWMRCMVERESLEDAFEIILRGLLDYYDAGSGFIRSFTSVETVKDIRTSGSVLGIPFVEKPAPELLRKWEVLFDSNKLVLIRSVEELAQSDPDSYELLKEWGVDNLCLSPIFSRKRLVGVMGLSNIKRRWEGIPMLQILDDYIAASIQKKLIREEKARIQYLDGLTGHLNFEGYKLQVNRLLRDNPNRKYALQYCDIKRFKFVNEVYGYDTGDRLLRYWSDYLDGHQREGETFCRISGDTMTVLQSYDRTEELTERFDNMAAYLANFPELAEKRMHVELACGIYLLPMGDRALAVGGMLTRANMAQKSVKEQPGSRQAFYTEEMRRKEIRQVELMVNMREALRNDEFLMYFQPQIPAGLGRGNEIRAEVLVRWQKDGTLIAAPGEFIDLFERNGFIVDLDHYMFEQACRYIRTIKEKFKKRVILSVNVSRITMLQPNFAEDYGRLKNKYRIPDGCIELEFTENVAVADVAFFAGLVKKMRNRGFLCAMDDFGTGQSSLNVLQALPLDILKLDQRFFKDGQNEKRKRIIVASILEMAKRLEMLTVAEGIESAEQVEALSEMGCDYIQGYYYSKPLSAGEFEEKYLRE